MDGRKQLTRLKRKNEDEFGPSPATPVLSSPGRTASNTNAKDSEPDRDPFSLLGADASPRPNSGKEPLSDPEDSAEEGDDVDSLSQSTQRGSPCLPKNPKSPDRANHASLRRPEAVEIGKQIEAEILERVRSLHDRTLRQVSAKLSATEKECELLRGELEEFKKWSAYIADSLDTKGKLWSMVNKNYALYSYIRKFGMVPPAQWFRDGSNDALPNSRPWGSH